MRVLVTAAPFHGHVNTVLPVARAADRAGHEVVVATGADLAELAARHGLATWPVGPTGVESGMPRSPADFWYTAGLRAADLLPLAGSWRPDVVVAEELELAGPVVAARTGARLFVHGIGIAPAGDVSGYAEDIDALGERWEVTDLARRHREAPYLTVCPPSLAPPESVRPTTVPVRPAIGEPAPGERLPEALTALPYGRTVHLTLGTVFNRRRPQAMTDAIAGLRELPVNLVVAVGPDVDPRSFGAQPAHVLLARYLPHSLLLPRCDLVVSQGGAGILLGALAHGLPQLILPQGADQFANGAALERAGVAVTLGDAGVTADQIRDAARTLLDGSAHRDRARLLAEEMRAMPSPDDAVKVLA